MTILTLKDYEKTRLYQLTKSRSIEKLSDHVGKSFNLVDYIQYVDETGGFDKTPTTILSLLCDDGTVIATNSPTVIESFDEIDDIFDCSSNAVKLQILSGTSKANRTFYYLIYVV